MMDETSRKPTVLHDGEGTTLKTQATRVVKADGKSTFGRLALSVVAIPVDFSGAPAHRHSNADEAFFILDGQFTFTLGDETADVGPGAFIFVPRGMAHSFVRRGAGSGQMIEMFLPADPEGYFVELAALVAGGQVSREKIETLQAKYGIEAIRGGTP